MHQYFVEFLGTMLLSFVVFGTGNYIAIGAALAVAVLLGGKISGGAFNPAIAVGLMASGKLRNNELLPYIIAEVLGALAGFELSKMIV
jgi:glycerol uptake facilitator-like aquaporin